MFLLRITEIDLNVLHSLSKLPFSLFCLVGFWKMHFKKLIELRQRFVNSFIVLVVFFIWLITLKIYCYKHLTVKFFLVLDFTIIVSVTFLICRAHCFYGLVFGAKFLCPLIMALFLIRWIYIQQTKSNTNFHSKTIFFT